MNKRQKKKNYKKVYSHNPPTNEVKIRQKRIEETEKNLIKIAEKRTKRIHFLEKELESKIQEMSKKEYQRVLMLLTPEQREQVKKIRYKE